MKTDLLPPAPGRLILIRHGETEHNVRQCFAGWTDSLLTERGRGQTLRLGAHVAASYRLDRLYASPLQRAWLTAQAISGLTGLPAEAVDDLREIHFGELEGLGFHQFEERFPDLYRRWRGAPDEDLQWPGGESRLQFRQRVLRTLAPLEVESRERTVAVVCHGGVIASYLAQRIAGDGRQWGTYHIRNCSITEIAWGDDHRPTVVLQDCIDHLDDI
jgi:broad specificity phosphatase PhoE